MKKIRNFFKKHENQDVAQINFLNRKWWFNLYTFMKNKLALIIYKFFVSLRFIKISAIKYKILLIRKFEILIGFPFIEFTNGLLIGNIFLIIFKLLFLLLFNIRLNWYLNLMIIIYFGLIEMYFNVMPKIQKIFKKMFKISLGKQYYGSGYNRMTIDDFLVDFSETRELSDIYGGNIFNKLFKKVYIFMIYFRIFSWNYPYIFIIITIIINLLLVFNKLFYISIIVSCLLITSKMIFYISDGNFQNFFTKLHDFENLIYENIKINWQNAEILSFWTIRQYHVEERIIQKRKLGYYFENDNQYLLPENNPPDYFFLYEKIIHLSQKKNIDLFYNLLQEGSFIIFKSTYRKSVAIDLFQDVIQPFFQQQAFFVPPMKFLKMYPKSNKLSQKTKTYLNYLGLGGFSVKKGVSETVSAKLVKSDIPLTQKNPPEEKNVINSTKSQIKLQDNHLIKTKNLLSTYDNKFKNLNLHDQYPMYINKNDKMKSPLNMKSERSFIAQNHPRLENVIENQGKYYFIESNMSSNHIPTEANFMKFSLNNDYRYGLVRLYTTTEINRKEYLRLKEHIAELHLKDVEKLQVPEDFRALLIANEKDITNKLDYDHLQFFRSLQDKNSIIIPDAIVFNQNARLAPFATWEQAKRGTENTLKFLDLGLNSKYLKFEQRAFYKNWYNSNYKLNSLVYKSEMYAPEPNDVIQEQLLLGEALIQNIQNNPNVPIFIVCTDVLHAHYEIGTRRSIAINHFLNSNKTRKDLGGQHNVFGKQITPKSKFLIDYENSKITGKSDIENLPED